MLAYLTHSEVRSGGLEPRIIEMLRASGEQRLKFSARTPRRQGWDGSSAEEVVARRTEAQRALQFARINFLAP